MVISVRVPERVVCVHISGENEYGMFIRLCAVCSVVCPCQLFCSVWMCCLEEVYINVCNSDVFSVVNMYLDHLKVYVGFINGQIYVCYSKYYVDFNECDEATYGMSLLDGDPCYEH